MKTRVKFIHPYPPFNRGEVALFPEARAKELVTLGFAMAIAEEPKEEISPLDEVLGEEAAKMIHGAVRDKMIRGKRIR